MFRRCQLDPALERVTTGPMRYPMGVYPIEPLEPTLGYTLDFEPADGSNEEGDWEEWPDRYVFDAVVGADRIEALCRALFLEFPARVYPILDVIGHDAYREIDPYISYDLIGLDRFLDAVQKFGPYFYEDGMVGFGAMCDDPFYYVFVDEHKIVTVRVDAEHRSRIESILSAFELTMTDHAAGADAAAHEHRGVLLSPNDRPDLLAAEEIVEHLRDEWKLALNVDPSTNVDDQGRDLGITLWRCLVRASAPEQAAPRYAEVLALASNLREAEELAHDASLSLETADEPPSDDLMVVAADRIGREQADALLSETGQSAPTGEVVGVLQARWLG